MKTVNLLLFLLISFAVHAQTEQPLSADLPDVVVTSYGEQKAENTAVNIALVKIDSLSKKGNYNLTDLLTAIPGVSMLSTGVAIAKPVIRGSYGNRILILIAGLKFDNQQWQEEHGLGLSDIGLSKAEIIKGPLGVLYGTEATGGIINLIPEQKAALNEKQVDVSVKLNSNTAGGMINAGYKINKGNKWFGLRAAIENNADYSDGNNTRVLNSRFDGYHVKLNAGWKKNNLTSNNNYAGSFNRFGFIFNDIYNFVSPDKRWSRNLQKNPAHIVLLNMLSSENKWQMQHSVFHLNFGLQSNLRMEKEGGGSISLNMHLFTVQYLAKWEKNIGNDHKLIISNLGSFEDNTNYGARKIIPDANMYESNVSVYLMNGVRKKWKFENGIGIGMKNIKTFFTAGVNSPEKEIDPFTKHSFYYNFFTGCSYAEKNVNLKLNIASGVRIPNLAELSSNGLHEGVFNYEIGSPLLKNEKNIAVNFLTHFSNEHIDVSFSPFYNYFFNYVFLAPTTEDWFGFPVFRFRQQNARQFGTECTFSWTASMKIKTGIAYAGMVSKTADKNYTPFQPAQKISPFIHYQPESKYNIQIYLNADHLFSQYNLYPGELATKAYTLVNAGISSQIKKRNNFWELSLTVNNILNTAYYDHMSRFKYFGLLNIGRNVVVMCTLKQHNKIKS